MDSLLPSLPALLVLSVLADEPAHGYQIALRIREQSGDVLDLKEGTLYPRLYQLEREGLVRGEWHTESGRRLRVYALTSTGHHRLERDLGEWKRRVRAADMVLSPPEGRPAASRRRVRYGDL